jgi:dihydrofolate reductase
MASSFGPGTRSDRSEDGGLLFGRRTYIRLHDAWRDRTANPFTDRLNAAHKYVASNTLAEPLPWENSTLITGDVPRAVTELKRKVLGDLVVIGSGMLLRSLMRHDLVDELLMTFTRSSLGQAIDRSPAMGHAYRSN